MVARVRKRLLLIVLGAAFVAFAIQGYRVEQVRTFTPVNIEGTLINLHTVQHQRGQTLHFQIQPEQGLPSSDLHTEEPLMFVKAETGQQVRAVYTRETGLVWKFSIVGGRGTGYSYNSGRDRSNFFANIVSGGAGLILIAVQIFGFFTDPTESQETSS